MPMLIVGSAIGVIVNFILPEPIITSVLVVSLIYITCTTGLKLYRNIIVENKTRREEKEKK